MDGTGDGSGEADPDHQPISVTASVLGKKWHPVIISRLLDAGPLGFNELKSQLDGISDKVQSESLDDLEDHGIVERTVIDDKPVRVEYSLTPLGEQLELVITAMEQWGDRYLAAVETAEEVTAEPAAEE
jgi:DNA-binding HxlR family transcriptional regulator